MLPPRGLHSVFYACDHLRLLHMCRSAKFIGSFVICFSLFSMMLGIEPRVSNMLDGCVTTELNLHP